MLVAIAAMTFLNSTFSHVMIQLISNPGLIEQLLFLSAYVALAVTILNKCFSLIYMLLDRVITWVGWQATGYGGAEEAVSAVKGGVAGGGAAMGGLGAAGKGGLDKQAGRTQELQDKAGKSEGAGAMFGDRWGKTGKDVDRGPGGVPR